MRSGRYRPLVFAQVRGRLLSLKGDTTSTERDRDNAEAQVSDSEVALHAGPFDSLIRGRGGPGPWEPQKRLVAACPSPRYRPCGLCPPCQPLALALAGPSLGPLCEGGFSVPRPRCGGERRSCDAQLESTLDNDGSPILAYDEMVLATSLKIASGVWRASTAVAWYSSYSCNWGTLSTQPSADSGSGVQKRVELEPANLSLVPALQTAPTYPHVRKPKLQLNSIQGPSRSAVLNQSAGRYALIVARGRAA